MGADQYNKTYIRDNWYPNVKNKWNNMTSRSIRNITVMPEKEKYSAITDLYTFFLMLMIILMIMFILYTIIMIIAFLYEKYFEHKKVRTPTYKQLLINDQSLINFGSEKYQYTQA
jgi:hypothetical protein